MKEGEYDLLVGEIYEAAWSFERWPRALELIAKAAGADIAQLYLVDIRERAILVSMAGGDADRILAATPSYLEYYGGIDPRGAKSAAARPGEWILCHEHFDATYASQSEFYQDFLLPHGMRYGIGTSLSTQNGVSTLLGLIHEDRPFSRGHHLPWLQRLTPHLQRSLALNRRLQQGAWAAATGQQFLERLAHPAVVCQEGAIVVQLNQKAVQLLQKNPGMKLESNRLVCKSTKTHSALLELIRNACNLRRGVLELDGTLCSGEPGVLKLQQGDSTGMVCVIPLSASSCLGEAVTAEGSALLLFNNPHLDTESTVRWLKDFYSCTAAEARVAVQLLHGRSPAEAALSLSVKLPTVRTHISRLLEKTNSRRISDLIHLLLSLPAFH
ncbi:helix-turn-helix transcriptional regulator [Pseudomonas japonica]|uniref:helix-turn-helix transcriptional regulator n=1 Tax=Pseudomonas japonica TaxID=256466 RepID=UPI0037FA7372